MPDNGGSGPSWLGYIAILGIFHHRSWFSFLKFIKKLVLAIILFLSLPKLAQAQWVATLQVAVWP